MKRPGFKKLLYGFCILLVLFVIYKFFNIVQSGNITVIKNGTDINDHMKTSSPVKFNNTLSTVKPKTKKSRKITRRLKLNSKERQLLCDEVIEWFTIGNDSLKDNRLNRHNFVFLVNSNLCSRKHISMLIFIHSAANNGQKRKLIRENWESVKANFTIIFMLGEDTSPGVQREIDTEAHEHGDIVQGDFIDTYRNITYKHIMAIHWVTSYCDNVSTIMKLDDDVFVNMYKLEDFPLQTEYLEDGLYCSRSKNVNVPRRGKWELTYKEYTFPIFPNFCEGMAYIMSMKVAKRLLKASENMSFLWIDDVFVTGILAWKAGVRPKTFRFGHVNVKYVWYKESGLESIDLNRTMFFTEFTDWTFLMEHLIRKRN